MVAALFNDLIRVGGELLQLRECLRRRLHGQDMQLQQADPVGGWTLFLEPGLGVCESGLRRDGHLPTRAIEGPCGK